MELLVAEKKNKVDVWFKGMYELEVSFHIYCYLLLWIVIWKYMVVYFTAILTPGVGQGPYAPTSRLPQWG